MKTISDIAKVIDSLHSTPKYAASGYPMVRVQDINSDFLDLQNALFVDEDSYISHTKNHKPKYGDIVITRVGSYGMISLVETDEDFCLGQNIAIISPNTDSKFLYYYLRSPYIQKYITGNIGGSAYKSLSLERIRSLPYIETISDPNKVGNFLYTIDKKIEINRKINAELEQMARTIYDYWFIQYDFPDETGKPYKSSGGQMIYDNQLKREIPEGWSAEKLDAVISRSGTGLNPRNNFKLGQGDNYYVTIKSVENGKIVLDEKCDKINNEALKIIQKRSDLQVGDILFTSIQPVGITYLIQEKPENWNINESVFTIRPNYEKVTSEYLYMLLSSQEMKTYTTNSSAGSIHKGIRHGVLKDFNVTLPPKEQIDQYSGIINPILKKMYQNDQESQKLTELRDWLLPMLMNGQVKVDSQS